MIYFSPDIYSLTITNLEQKIKNLKTIDFKDQDIIRQKETKTLLNT